MPVQDFVRDQQWLLPPTLSQLIPEDHAVRFVAEFVDALTIAEWEELGTRPQGTPLGRPSYPVRALLGIWIYGFMVGIRSNRKLERACREQLPFLWLTGMATPDHNTLWGFYHEHREKMRKLLRRTIQVAVGAGLVDLAIQAVDGTKIWGSASRERFRSRTGLLELLAQTDLEIAKLEAVNATSIGGLPSLPKELKSQQKLREKVIAALAQLPPASEPDRDPPAAAATTEPVAPGKENGKGKAKKKPEAGRGPRASLTDPDVRVMKGRHNTYGLGYNAQAVASPLKKDAAGRGGRLVKAVGVSNHAADVHELIEMLEEAEARTGDLPLTLTEAEAQAGDLPVTLADSGYHSAANLAAAEARGQTVYMPDPKAPKPAPDGRFGRDAFIYDPESDTYRCPEGQTLDRQTAPVNRREEQPVAIRYEAPEQVCAACPVRARCQQGEPGTQTRGRSFTVSADEELLRKHRELMAREEVREAYKRRKGLIEPVFAMMKGEQDGGHFLLPGEENVLDELHLLGTSGNLLTLWRRWKRQPVTERFSVMVAAA